MQTYLVKYDDNETALKEKRITCKQWLWEFREEDKERKIGT